MAIHCFGCIKNRRPLPENAKSAYNCTKIKYSVL
nr:MAG TPA: Hydrogen maturase F tetramerization domain protein [Caudoviricetes sp.]